MAMADPVATRELDALDVLDALIAVEEAALIGRTTSVPRPARLAAGADLPGGVASKWQDAPPCPVFIDRGAVARVRRRRYGVRRPARRVRHDLAGHAHPAHRRGGLPTASRGHPLRAADPRLVVVAPELARRFGLPMWRFTNSGTESTLAAIHLCALPGRDRT